MVSELNYMSQIVVMLYEDPTKDPCSEERFHVELHFSPGVNCCVQKILPPGPGFRPHSRNDASAANVSRRRVVRVCVALRCVGCDSTDFLFLGRVGFLRCMPSSLFEQFVILTTLCSLCTGIKV